MALRRPSEPYLTSRIETIKFFMKSHEKRRPLNRAVFLLEEKME